MDLKKNPRIAFLLQWESTAPFIQVLEGGREIIQNDALAKFLYKNGIRTVSSDYGKSFVRINNGVIYTDYQVGRFVTGDVEDYIKRSGLRESWDNALKYCLESLEEMEVTVHRDTADESLFYFKNGIIEVTKDGIWPIVHSVDGNKVAWVGGCTTRNFRIVKGHSMFEIFCSHISDCDEERFSYLCSLIGYMLHTYPEEDRKKIVVICDENEQEFPFGFNGKSLLVKAIGAMRNLSIKDSRNERKSEYLYSKIGISYQSDIKKSDILLIDNLCSDFDIDQLEKINMYDTVGELELKIPIYPAPLIVATINGYPEPVKPDNFYQLDISHYYNKNYTPLHEFRQSFFTEWDENEWARFDKFMLQCVHLYLKNGIIEPAKQSRSKVKPTADSPRTRRKVLTAATCPAFADWAEENLYYGISCSLYDAFAEYESASGVRRDLNEDRFVEWIKIFCDLYGMRLTKGTGAAESLVYTPSDGDPVYDYVDFSTIRVDNGFDLGRECLHP